MVHSIRVHQWSISSSIKCFVLEVQVKPPFNGRDSPVGLETNNPPWPFQKKRGLCRHRPVFQIILVSCLTMTSGCEVRGRQAAAIISCFMISPLSADGFLSWVSYPASCFVACWFYREDRLNTVQVMLNRRLQMSLHQFLFPFQLEAKLDPSPWL